MSKILVHTKIRCVSSLVRLGKRGNLKLKVFTGCIIPSERLRTSTVNIAILEHANLYSFY
jgi:hypothetical protein